MVDTFFIDSSGEVVPVPADQVAGASQLGWVPASPKQIEDYQLDQKYGGAGEGAKAFAEHAASAVTLGLSDVAERATGLSTPEAMAGREKAHPIASVAGTAAGIIAPLAADAVGIPTGPAAIAKLGEATTTAVRAALPAETAIGRIAARAVASGAGSAIEGAAYGVGQVVHEAALGDPDLTAQTALGTIGLSSIFAGGLGAGGGFLAGAMPEIVPRDLGAKVSSLLEQSEGHSNLNATNARPGEIRKIFTSKGEENATRIGVEARDLGIIRNPFTDSPDAIFERAGQVKSEQGQVLERILGETAPGGPVTNFEAIRGDVENPIVKALKSQGSTVAIGEQFEAMLNRFGEAYGERELDLNGLWKLKQDIGDFIYRQGKVIDPWAKELNTPLKRVYDHIDSLIGDGIKEGGGSEAVAAWREANRNFEVAATLERLAQKGIERSAENNALHLSGQVGTLAGAVAGGPGAGAALGTASELARRRGASALGWAARNLRHLVDGGEVEAVVNKTASAISAERAAGIDTIAPAVAADEASKLAAVEGVRAPVPGSPVQAAETNALQVGAQVDAEKLRRIEAGRKPGTGGSANVAEANARADALRTAEAMGQDQGVAQRPAPAPGEADRMAQALGLKAAPTSSAPEKVATLATLERMNAQAQAKIRTGVAAVLRGSARAGRGEAEAGIASSFGRSPDEAQATFNRRAAQVRQLANDPALMQAKLMGQTGDWQDHAPNTAQALQIRTANAISFLASKLPQTGQAGPLAGKAAPNRADISKFTRYYEAVQKPLGVLKQAAAGTLTPEAIEALSVVYPKLYDQMRAQVVAKMGGRSNIPYQQKLMLSMLVGQDLDGSMASAARNFAVYMRPTAAPAQQRGPSKGVPRAAKFTLASRTLTDSQASAQRRP